MNRPKDSKRCTAKQVICIGKVFRCTNWINKAYEKKLCSSCLLNKFGLTKPTYDTKADPWSSSPLYDEDDVVMALRKASGL